jgi:hypothetical protein
MVSFLIRFASRNWQLQFVLSNCNIEPSELLGRALTISRRPNNPTSSQEDTIYVIAGSILREARILDSRSEEHMGQSGLDAFPLEQLRVLVPLAALLLIDLVSPKTVARALLVQKADLSASLLEAVILNLPGLADIVPEVAIELLISFPRMKSHLEDTLGRVFRQLDRPSLWSLLQSTLLSSRTFGALCLESAAACSDHPVSRRTQSLTCLPADRLDFPLVALYSVIFSMLFSSFPLWLGSLETQRQLIRP